MSESCCKSCSHGNDCEGTTHKSNLVWKAFKARKLARRMEFQGLDISIETDKGQYREWYDPHNKEEGRTLMRYPYGYIRRTEGADDEQVDCYIGPDPKA